MTDLEAAARADAQGGEPNPIRARHVLAAVIGNALEFYDFTTYAFFAVQIGAAFFPAKSEYVQLMASLGTFGAGFLFRPLGGYVLGRYTDRVGRRPSMMLSFVLMGSMIVVMALIPPYSMIGVAAPLLAILARMIQGFALGGEIGSTTTYLFEASPLHRRGLYTSLQGLSQSVSALAGSGLGTILAMNMSDAALSSYGWRIAFLVGAITLPVGLYLRNRLPETLHLRDEAQAYVPLKPGVSVFRTHGRIIALGLLIFLSGTIATYVFNYMTTYARTTLHFGSTLSFTVSVVINSCAIVSGLAAGIASDRLGRRATMAVPRVLFLLLIYPAFVMIVHVRSAEVLLIGMGILSFVSAASQAPIYASLSESLPKPIRGSGFAIIYSTAIAVFGGTTQPIITWLIHVTGNPLAPAWYLTAASAIGLVAMLMMPETAPARLQPSARAAS